VASPPEPSAKLSWTEVKGGAAYHVALDYNVTQANLLLSAALEETGVKGTSHDIKGLNLGRYFWRVAAVNKDGLEGAYSRVSHFQVVEPEVPQAAATPTPETPRPRSWCRRSTRCRPASSTSAGAPRGATVTVNGTP
jgi:predicted phage tail protein